MTPIYRKSGETERSFQLRRFNAECERMSNCHILQEMRMYYGEYGPASFYQLEARSAYIRMIDARAKIARIDAENIPGTACRWDDIFAVEEWPGGSGELPGPNVVTWGTKKIDPRTIVKCMPAGLIDQWPGN